MKPMTQSIKYDWYLKDGDFCSQKCHFLVAYVGTRLMRQFFYKAEIFWIHKTCSPLESDLYNLIHVENWVSI